MMPAHTLRFAHAGQVRIDAPLEGVGWLPDEARRRAEDAPITSWECAVEHCIDREVDFLLLTPRTVASELCAYDRAALLGGFHRLDEFNIPVYWALAPGEPDCDGLPENVSILKESQGAVSVICAGRVAATISLGQLDRAPGGDAGTDQPLRIRVADETVDMNPQTESQSAGSLPVSGASFVYVACWGGKGERVRTFGPEVWSDAGSPLNRTADELGGGGINIVEWVPGNLPEVMRAPTAVVHWQRCLLGLNQETTREELSERLQLALLEREPAICEQLWLIDWHIVGAGREFERLQSSSARCAMEETIEQVLGRGERLQRVHRWDLRRRALTVNDAVSQRLIDWLVTHAPAECESISRDLTAPLQQSGASDLAGRLPGLRIADVRADAEQLLGQWLGSPPAAPGSLDSTVATDGGATGDGV